MKEFLMLFRNDHQPDYEPSPEQLQASVKEWQDWIGGIAAQGKFVGTNALGPEGKTINSKGMITDGPYAEVKEIIGGYLLAKANDLEEAMELAKGCPMFAIGGSVEVRAVMQFEV